MSNSYMQWTGGSLEVTDPCFICREPIRQKAGLIAIDEAHCRHCHVAPARNKNI